MSVLLPVRDAAATLDEALGSLSRQTLGDFEILAVDDGSRDDSGARLRRHARAEPRLRVLTAAGSGLVAALNQALEQARAPLVARMDADDVTLPARLERQVERLERDVCVDVLGCLVELVAAPAPPRADGGMRRYVAWQNSLLEHDDILADLYVESPLVHPSVAMRTARLRALGGWRDFDGPEDYDLWLRAAQAGWRFAKLSEVLLRWRDRPDRLTRRDPRYAAERFRALKVEALEAGPLRAGRPLLVWGGGPVAKSWVRALHGRGHGVSALVDVAPRRIGGRAAGVPVVGLQALGDFPGALHLAAVGQPGARERIRRLAASLGLRYGADLLAVA